MATPPAARPAIQLEVGGQKLRLSANADPAHLEVLAAMVNERITALQRGTRSATHATLLALVALDLADEVVAARKRADEARADRDRAVAEAAHDVARCREEARVALTEAIAEVDRALLDDDLLAAHDG